MLRIHLHHITFIVAIVFSVSCNSKQVEVKGTIELVDGTSTITIPQGSYSNTIKISDFVSDLQVVPLELTSKSMLASIDKVFMSLDRVYVFDMIMGQIVIFNRNGEYVGSIADKGQGPGEFNTITDFHVDLDRERLILYDRSLFKFIIFNLDGSFRQEVQKNIAGESITVDFQGNIIVFKNNWFPIDTQGAHYNISVLDSSYTIVKEFYPLNPLLIHWRHRAWDHFHKNNQSNRILFNTYSDFNIYSISESNFEVAYKIDAGARATDFEQLFHDTPLPHIYNERLERINSIRGIDSFFESEDYIQFHFWDTELRNVILDKKLNKIAVYSGFENDIADHVIYRKIFGLDGDYVFLVGPPLSDNELRNKYGECCIHEKRALSESRDRGNPVLFIGKLDPVEELFN